MLNIFIKQAIHEPVKIRIKSVKLETQRNQLTTIANLYMTNERHGVT
jgi:hypothetical protein